MEGLLIAEKEFAIQFGTILLLSCRRPNKYDISQESTSKKRAEGSALTTCYTSRVAGGSSLQPLRIPAHKSPAAEHMRDAFEPDTTPS